MILRSFVVGSALALSTLAWGAEDPGARALHRHQLERDQQQNELQLKLLQFQHAVRSPAADLRQQQERDRAEINQRQRQQELHYRQAIEPATAQPSDDAGTRRAKQELGQQRRQEQARQQLQRFDDELRRNAPGP